MRRAFKKGVIAIVGLIVFWVWVERELLAYLIMQGRGQVEILWQARDIVEVLEDESVDPEIKGKILLVDEVKAFAEQRLGLESAGLYTKLYDQQGKDILWNLSACEPYELRSVEWRFPIVGSVSYKGFFDLASAQSEQQALEAKGLDTRIRSVNAWSTLGWFSDPILSKNLKRSEGSVAELFIHEITHANIFLKDSLTFNENLASFIGEEGARLFLVDRYGKDREAYQVYVEAAHDAQLFVGHCLNGVSELTHLYASFDDMMSIEEKSQAKQVYLSNWVARLDTIPFFDNVRYQGLFEDVLPNNAFFMAFERYDSKKENFKKQLETSFKGDLAAFVTYYKMQN
ncbi:aminopeptidase [Reichenbachiella carrageenanivorans]|uniref:Aminopeptidase n=1 Tax=Reichenbachiella carrageenanivorans TaxID=2979869 RepID=A0ABY6D081_9BACT|nr:aminopeptidase [Reichenbachiella carrageenanivorans]UXX79571.1 aminopeptidase [Reichenbachiella carrageenanivorans]